MVTVWGKGSSNFGLCYSLLNKKKPKPEGIKRNLTNFLSCTWEENYMVNQPHMPTLGTLGSTLFQGPTLRASHAWLNGHLEMLNFSTVGPTVLVQLCSDSAVTL